MTVLVTTFETQHPTFFSRCPEFQTQVKKINLEGKRATSVLARNNFKDLVTIEARKGVILAGGAVFSPQLLQVSGIGDPKLLQGLGVATVIENPQVGQNFVDRAILNFGVWASKSRPLYIGYAMSSNTTSQLTIESEGPVVDLYLLSWF